MFFDGISLIFEIEEFFYLTWEPQYPATKFKSSFKNSKLVHIALFKDQYLEYFMQNKELSPMIESPVINLVEVTETSDHQWLMMIPVKYKRKNTLIYLSLGKNKSVKIEQDLKTIFEEKL